MNQTNKANLISYWQDALLKNNFDRLLSHQNFWWIGRDFEQIENNPTSLILNDKNLNKIVSDYGKKEIIDDEQVITGSPYWVSYELDMLAKLGFFGKLLSLLKS